MLYAALLYITLLQRDGTPVERAARKAELDAGTPLVNVIRNILALPEFTNLTR
jgi:hypothetical protein